MTTMTVPEDVKQMSVNLKAPIIINADTRKGAQIICENDDYEVKYKVYDALARKVNESIVINDNIEITVLEVKGDQIKLGIDAPKSVPVYRKELYVQIQEANQAAVNTPGPKALGDMMNGKNA